MENKKPPIVAVTVKQGLVTAIMVPFELYQAKAIGVVIDYDIDGVDDTHRMPDGKRACVTLLEPLVGAVDLLEAVVEKLSPMYQIIFYPAPENAYFGLVRRDGFVLASSSERKYLDILLKSLIEP